MQITVNGRSCDPALRPATLLVELLRDELQLTGTHVGCDTAQCGACTVLVDGRATKACNVLTLQLDGARVQTIESLAPEPGLHPLQLAFSRHHALQCGYCTPGQIMSALGLVRENRAHTDDEVREHMSGNLCRCGAYPNIVRAIQRARAASAPG